MASQYTTDIPFTASHEQKAFKLLELPPELLTLLESDNPPNLTITSSEGAGTGPGYATLHYGDKRYQMRQKNTSNPLMILKPLTTMPAEEDNEETVMPTPSVTIISKIEDTIELILQEETPKAQPKVNKWHEKFAKSRPEKKG